MKQVYANFEFRFSEVAWSFFFVAYIVSLAVISYIVDICIAFYVKGRVLGPNTWKLEGNFFDSIHTQ